MSDFTGLAIAGQIATPTDPDWDQVRAAWNLVAAARGGRPGRERRGHRQGCALRRRARPAGRRPGHRPRRRRARLARGHDPGYTLGGGLSWLGRRYGFACNRVRAIELVTADGEQRTVDAESDPNLFWALRGGGGGYALVVALHLNLVPISEIYAGALVFPAELGADAVRAYRDWVASVSDDVTSVVRFITPPPLPDVAEPIRGRPLLTIDGACIGSQSEGEATVAPLRELGETIMDTWGQIPAESLCRIHMDPENPVPGLGHHALLRELPGRCDRRLRRRGRPGVGLAAAADRAAPPRRRAGPPRPQRRRPRPHRRRLRPLRRRHDDEPRDGPGDRLPPRPRHRVDAALGGRGRLLQLRRAPLRRRRDPPPEVCARLAEVKRRYDPDNRIVSNHAVAIAPA